MGFEAFDYLIELHRHPDAFKATHGAWLSWTYRETVRQLCTTLRASA